MLPPLTRTVPSAAFQESYARRRMRPKSKSGASARRLRRAPARSTNEIPTRIVTVRLWSASNETHELPVEENGSEKRATKYTGYRDRVEPESSLGPLTWR